MMRQLDEMQIELVDGPIARNEADGVRPFIGPGERVKDSAEVVEIGPGRTQRSHRVADRHPSGVQVAPTEVDQERTGAITSARVI